VMERSPEYREMDRIVTRLVEGGHINVDPHTETVRVETAGVAYLAEPVEDANRKLAFATKLIATLEAELLRVRTTGHGAAHELDNIAVECGLGHSPKPGDVAAHVRTLEARCKVLEGFIEESRELLACVDKLGIRKLVAGWHGENNPRGPYPPHPKNLGVKLDTTAGLVVLMDRAAEALRKHDAATTDAAKAREGA